jgi:peptidoglycan/xylan/chitin deacetylase (PgdA/CDA1 family)
MGAIEPPPQGARGADSGRAGLARRARIRRRRAALALVLAAVVLTTVALLGRGSSHGRPLVPSAGHAAGVTNAQKRGGRGGGTPAATPRAGPAALDSSQSREISRLIALGKPIYCAAPRGNEVALTFDDGPGPYTRLVIAKLRKHDIRATFFIVGRNIPLVTDPGGSSIVRDERGVGALGDHTFTHPLLTALAPADAERQIVRTQAALEHASRGPVFLFRPPYGGRDARIDAIVRAHGLLQILWTVDSADSLGASYAQIERNVIAGLRGGAIVLMHENHGQTVRALLAIFAALQRKHLRAVSVPQLLSDDPPSLAQVRAGGAGCGISNRGAPNGG